MADDFNIDWSKCDSKKVIDCRKRGRTQDITDSEFVVREPEMKD